ncbi:MAG: hypothetical protein IJ150_01190 [Bacteroidales bacterium]|nr:hypothetical protein [Bacteroidales bacterium]
MFLAACNESLNEATEVEKDSNESNQEQENVDFSEPSGITILGKKLANPYSISNMRKALMEIQNNGISKSANDFDIIPNTLYIRFLPKDSTEMNLLLADTAIELFDRPMDYEIESEGEYYHDPELPDSVITWQYTSVPMDYEFPKIKYEILDTCFVPDDLCEEKTISKLDILNLNNLLEETAYKITGNENQLEKNLSKAKRGQPHGRFRVEEPDGLH